MKPGHSGNSDVSLRVSSDGSLPLALYFHWPYCARICPYCDFNVRKDTGVDEQKWMAAFVQSIKTLADTYPGRTLRSVYFGGGTPSLMSPALVSTLISTALASWESETSVEITLEANPTDVEMSRFRAFREAGVNRLSLGVQSLDNEQLEFLGRNHTGSDARLALDTALAVFESVSFDLIYALPHQTPSQWRQQLRAALGVGAPHLSLYQLTVEQGTAFERAVNRGHWKPTDGDACADFFDLTQEETASAGLTAYEISNHAKRGARSVHNLTYWRGDEYLGIGPGAHGRMTVDNKRMALVDVRDPSQWLDEVTELGHGVAEKHDLSQDEWFSERVSMGLRCEEGVGLSQDEWNQIQPNVSPLIEEGFMEQRDDRLVTTHKGKPVLNALLAEVLNT
ncbi:MAG: radical SAM family heme chaperone HemW [Pseudomonadota bacterium]